MTIHKEEIICPLTNSRDLLLITEIPKKNIIRSYQKSLNFDTSSYFNEIDTVKIFECRDSGYRFYYPYNLGADNKLYEHLQQFNWYYLSWKWEYDTALEWIPENASVLEVGCGEGHFLKHISKVRSADCTGLELNKRSSGNKTGIPIINEDIREFSKSRKNTYDVVCSFQVLEHIAGVKEFLESKLQCLKPGGYLIISVPNNDAFIKYDHGFYLNMPPHHMGLWNEDSLRFIEKVLDVKVKQIIKEPLQPYHYEYYFRTINKHNLSYPMYKLKKFLYKAGLKKYYLGKIEKSAKDIEGHSILGVYEKM